MFAMLDRQNSNALIYLTEEKRQQKNPHLLPINFLHWSTRLHQISNICQMWKQNVQSIKICLIALQDTKMMWNAEDGIWSLVLSFGWTQPCVIVSVTKNSLCRYVKLAPFCSLKVDLRNLIVFPSLMTLFFLGFLPA